jgi:DNA-binding response OmpR family regulator
MARILLIDDDPELRNVVRAMFERSKSGHEIVEAEDALEGLEVYRADHADLVIMDMLMPKKPGWEAVLDFKREFPSVRILGISGGGKQGPFGYLMLAKRFGAKRVLMKPFSKNELLEAVDEMLGGREPGDGAGNLRVPRAPEKKSILLVDGNPSDAWCLCECLTKAGHSVTHMTSALYAKEALEHRDFDVAILDVAAIRHEEMDLIRLLRARPRRPVIIVMAEFDSVPLKTRVISRGADHFLGKPVDIQELHDLMFPPQSFMGHLRGFDLLEYLQFILLSGKKTVVEVQSTRGETCRLFFRNGNIVHATCADYEGEAAFFRCVYFQGGTLTNLPWETPDQESVEARGEYLLMEAARRRDDENIHHLQM